MHFSQLKIMEDTRSRSGRVVVVLRHGERMDLTFGNSYIKEDYVKTDLNMPESLPERDIRHWEFDTPLTKQGEYQASLVGSSLKDSGMKFSHVFVSPAYRCLQTAKCALKAMGMEDLTLNIEYGLFEWIGFYKNNLPQWLTEEMAGKTFNINQNYESIISREEYQNSNSETLDEIYDNNSRVTKEILAKFDGNVLIFAHGGNLETCTREMLGKPKRPWDQLKHLLAKVPYLGVTAMQQIDDSLYKLIEPPCLPFTHEAKTAFNWKIFEDDFIELETEDETRRKVAEDLISKLI